MTRLYESVIDGHKYEFAKWGAERATDVLMDLTHVAGKTMSLGATLASQARAGADVDKADMLGQLVESLAGAIGDKRATCKSLIRSLASDCTCDGATFDFNSHYEDRLSHMFKVVRTALEVQFGRFFSETIATIEALAPPKADPTATPK